MVRLISQEAYNWNIICISIHLDGDFIGILTACQSGKLQY